MARAKESSVKERKRGDVRWENQILKRIEGCAEGIILELGKKMGLGQSAISAGIKNCSFNFDDLGKIFELLEFTEEDIIKVMRG